MNKCKDWVCEQKVKSHHWQVYWNKLVVQMHMHGKCLQSQKWHECIWSLLLGHWDTVRAVCLNLIGLQINELENHTYWIETIADIWPTW